MSEEKLSSASSPTEKLYQQEDQENPHGQDITTMQIDQTNTDQFDKATHDDDDGGDHQNIVVEKEGNGEKEGGGDDQEVVVMKSTETLVVGGGAGCSGVKKRGRSNSFSGEGSSSNVGGENDQPKQRKKGEFKVPINRSPICYICEKTFGSWKALFGHMRAHPSRVSPGVFPPPTFTPQGSPERVSEDQQLALREQLAPTLLNLARQTMERLSQQQNDQHNSDSSTNRTAPIVRRGLDIDLNLPTPRVYLFDLNEPPPPEKDDGDGLNHAGDDIDDPKN